MKTETKASTRKAKTEITKEQAVKKTKQAGAKGKSTKAEVKQTAAKPEAKKLTTAKAAPAIAAKPSPKRIAAAKEPKRIAAKKQEAIELKKAPKKTKKQLAAEKDAVYDLMNLEDCFAVLHAHGFTKQYWDVVELLTYERDVDEIVKRLVEESEPQFADATYEKDGCDRELVERLVQFVRSQLPISAPDFADLCRMIDESLGFEAGEEFGLNSEEYLKEFHLMEKLLVIGQRYHLDSLEKVGELLKHSVMDFPAHFMKFAYATLPQYQYKDVVFYEDFMYEVLGQFADLYGDLQLELQLDVADLYIKHGDQWHGDEDYRYLLRDNQIKDYIYYRYASVYLGTDLWKAKEIAKSALACVDWRYRYYDALCEIASMELPQ